MNLFELFDGEQEDRQYYQAKRPLAVILALLGFASLFLCTPAGATYLQTWLLEIMPHGAIPASWVIAIAFDLTFAYTLSQVFKDIFTGINGRSTYWDIPTMALVVVFGGITLCWSLWGGDMRKGSISKEFHEAQSATIDNTYSAMAGLILDGEKVSATTEETDRDQRKNNEEIVKDKIETTTQLSMLSGITDKKIEQTAIAESNRHSIIENGKMIIVGAYLFLLISIACVEYIKSKKEDQATDIVIKKSQKKDSNIRDINSPTISEDEKKKELIRLAQELRAKTGPNGKHLHSLRAIGNELGVSHTQVSNYLKQNA
jgi:predicted transcriptional regulator